MKPLERISVSESAIWGISLCLYLVLGSCSEQPTRPLDTQDVGGALYKATASEYIPGSDITDQLISDLAAGLDVTLPSGHFYVSRSIFVSGYSGTIKGAGKHQTIIEATEGYQTVHNPQLEIEMAQILALVRSTGDVAIKGMTILVTGEAPTEPHFNPWLGMVTAIDNVIVVNGAQTEANTGITVTLKDLLIKGEYSSDSMSANGRNLAYALITTGAAGNEPVNATTKDCEIENAGAYAIEYYHVRGGSGEIKGNDVENSLGGIFARAISDPLNTSEVTVKGNTLGNVSHGMIPAIQHPMWMEWSSYCLKDNSLDGVLLPDDCQ